MKLDYREKKLFKYFPDAEIVNLPIGDLLYKNLCIERKSMGDFIFSIQDRRLFNQAANMKANYTYPYIFVEGDLKSASQHIYFAKSHMKMSHIIGATASVMMRYGVPVIFCSGTKYMVDLIYRMIDKYNGDNIPISTPVKKRANPQLQVLLCIPGIGIKKAERILNHYKTIGNINLNSKPDKVSKKDIEKILEVLR